MRAAVLFMGLVTACPLLWDVPARADAIADIINQVTVAEHQAYERILTGVDPLFNDPPYYLTSRWALGVGAGFAAQWIDDHFAALGLQTSQHIFNYQYSPNVIADLRGTTRPDDIYIISAHYDTVPNTPGCDDNGSGTAAVMMAARILSQYQFEGTIRFIVFSGEEQGLLGSTAYATAAYNEGQNIKAVINLDMILHPGWDNVEPDPDYDLDILTDQASWWLATELAARYATYTPIDFEVQIDEYGNSDHSPFWQFGYSAIRLAEHTAPELWWYGANDAYHQPTDTFFNPDYDWEFARHAIRGGLAELVMLAGLVPEPSSFALVAAFLVLAKPPRRA